ncbi:low affinity iron permease family protein [Catellatospora sp. KI3]|uniref:low affinity iron permease family protein n=1 Tax=Catellatospora sp. KI3 TaxID=3041620 RepID=UPI0024831D93|nr:low affinity iron permease family protein [Catellatospora sp. KI3]MDI1463233.1 low affinity iron permease family protein [Catellatospora sp. KI3]
MQPTSVRASTRNKISTAARRIVDFAGSAWAAAAAVAMALLWLAGGLIGGFTEHWMTVLVAVTSVFTFIMVFLIQHTAGRESRAILLKLDELVRATSGARNDLIAAEQRPLHEQDDLEEQVHAAT